MPLNCTLKNGEDGTFYGHFGTIQNKLDPSITFVKSLAHLFSTVSNPWHVAGGKGALNEQLQLAEGMNG